MYPVGEIPRKAERLIEVTYEAMMRGIAAVKPGGTTGDIGAAIQSFVEPQHMSVVRDFCGHGLGRLFHDEPNIVHIGRAGEGIVLKPGMLFTIEPMINLGRPHVKVLSDGWTAVTRDRSLSAQFEHTVGVTTDGCEMFTVSPQGGTSRPIGTGRRQPRIGFRDCKSAVPVILSGARLEGSADRLFVCATLRPIVPRAAGLAEAPPHYHGHRERLRARFLRGGRRRRWPTTRCWSSCCFAPCRGAT